MVLNSLFVLFYRRVEQRSAYLAHTQGVVGSNPTMATIQPSVMAICLFWQNNNRYGEGLRTPKQNKMRGR